MDVNRHRFLCCVSLDLVKVCCLALVGMHYRVFGDVQKYGFVAPTDVAELNCPARSHKFRLTHDLSTHTWNLYASLCGGQAAVHVAFRGPNEETWATMDVVVPYDQPMPSPTFDDWYRPLDTTRAVIDAREILPSIPWSTGEVRVREELFIVGDCGAKRVGGSFFGQRNRYVLQPWWGPFRDPARANCVRPRSAVEAKLPLAQSYSRPISMSFEDFDSEMAISDCFAAT